MLEFLGKSQLNLSYLRVNYDEFQRKKINWLDSNKEYSQATKRTYWVLINNNVCPMEKKKNKDLYDFTNEEIEEIINQAESNNMKTMTILKSIIINYTDWAIENGYKLKENPDDGSLDKSKLFKSFRTQFVINYKTLDEFYEMLEKLKCSDVDKMMLVLARYGIAGKKLAYMCNLKWEDVDKESMIVNIGNDIRLPIDERFITYLDRAHKCELYDYKTSTLKYIDYGYVMKVSDKSEDNIININTLCTRDYSIFKNNGMARISFGDFTTWRKFDLLFEISDNKGEITYDDVKNVLVILEGKYTNAKAQYLKERFVILKDYNEYIASKI